MEKKTIRIHVLNCGKVMVDRALPFGADETLKTEEDIDRAVHGGRSQDFQIMLAVHTFLIEHPKGLLLVDTGWGEDIRYDQEKALRPHRLKINKGFLPRGQAIDEQLNAMGIDPADIDYVLISHLHCDHIHGVKLVADAKNILVSDIELEAATGAEAFKYEPSFWKGVDLKTFHLEETGIGPHGKSFDLFGDGSVVMVSLAGHTPGLCGCLIKNNGKFVLITGDAAYAASSWEQMLRPGIAAAPDNAWKSLQWIREMSEKPDCLRILTVHDPELKPQVIEL